MTGQTFVADFAVSDYQIRLVCVDTGYGIAGNVFVRTSTEELWQGPPEWYKQMDAAKIGVRRMAQSIVGAIGRFRIPDFEWQSVSLDDVSGSQRAA